MANFFEPLVDAVKVIGFVAVVAVVVLAIILFSRWLGNDGRPY